MFPLPGCRPVAGDGLLHEQQAAAPQEETTRSTSDTKCFVIDLFVIMSDCNFFLFLDLAPVIQKSPSAELVSVCSSTSLSFNRLFFLWVVVLFCFMAQRRTPVAVETALVYLPPCELDRHGTVPG